MTTPRPLPEDRLDAAVARRAELENALAEGGDRITLAALGRELKAMTPLAEAALARRALLIEREGVSALLAEAGGDAALAELARAERDDLDARLAVLAETLAELLLPRDEADARDVILEVRAGTGGDEAALFAGDLLRMYERYAALRGWHMELIELAEGTVGGVKEAVAQIAGEGAFARLRYESGVHRVQRVPATETSGRIHTSAATVAVLPRAEEADVTIADDDLRIDTMRAGGAGGQHVNKTESAVRITHLPSGIAVVVQDERSQHRNRARAMDVLRSRLFEAERERLANARAADRRGQVGSGDRSERIRTYNFPQGRLTDHRVGLTLHKLDEVLAGTALDEVVDALASARRESLLAEDEG